MQSGNFLATVRQIDLSSRLFLILTKAPIAPGARRREQESSKSYPPFPTREGGRGVRFYYNFLAPQEKPIPRQISLPEMVKRIMNLGCNSWMRKNGSSGSPATAPDQLKTTLTQIDAAANSRDVNSVMQFYAANFKHSDGLTREAMAQALTELWKRYPQLTYRTELKDWKAEGNSIVAETVTNITGTQASEGMTMNLESIMRSRQRFDNQKIVQQDILAERTQISSGVKPPSIQINLPEQVGVGQPYNFDVIVTEPLGDDLLLGTALEESIKPEGFIKPTNLKLELLSAGGVFKLGKAPATQDNRWLSAVLIRGNGMIMVTQRLQVVERPTNSAAPLQ